MVILPKNILRNSGKQQQNVVSSEKFIFNIVETSLCLSSFKGSYFVTVIYDYVYSTHAVHVNSKGLSEQRQIFSFSSRRAGIPDFLGIIICHKKDLLRLFFSCCPSKVVKLNIKPLINFTVDFEVF